MIRCSFCENPLTCKACARPFRPRRADTHLAVYQPDMAITCPECERPLVCKWCGTTYGDEEDDHRAR